MNLKQIVFISSCAFVAVAGVISCKKNDLKNIDGFRPIYDNSNASDFSIISKPSKAYTFPGKIIQLGNTTFQIDNGSGVHVIDASDITNPKKTAFIQVFGVTDMMLKDNVLYVNHNKDLVALDISNINTIVETARIKDQFVPYIIEVPPVHDAFFECVDASKGKVVAWEKVVLDNPKCKTTNK